MRKKIALINQRYGNEVNGGSEYYTQKLAEHLTPYYDVEVLTTTARDYDTWAPYYPDGDQFVNGIAVKRFHVEKQRPKIRFRVINKLLYFFPCLGEFLEPFWIRAQGPYCPALIRYIEAQKDAYDAFIFVTYLYYTTAVGLPVVKEKAIFVPTAHDEYCIYFGLYRQLFQKAKGIAYLTEEEQNFAQKLFKNETVPHRIAGSGIELPKHVDVDDFREKYNIDSDYVVYVGRVEKGKNCDELFEYMTRFNKKADTPIRLVVVGKMMMEAPESEYIQCLGFVSEEEKYAAMAGAKLLIMPSEHESLSLVVLEAMAQGTPVMVNGRCDVLEGHCIKSGAGISYRDFDGFEAGIKKIFSDSYAYEKMKTAGIQYVKENYNWDNTVEKYRELIEM
jgi:glycosyltransferase involved in cell wall biosynthesis